MYMDVYGCGWMWMDVDGLEEDWRHGKVRPSMGIQWQPRRKTELSIFDALDVGGCRWLWMYVDVHGLEEDWRHGKVRF